MKIAVRKQADWMSKNDDRILEYLSTSPRSRPRDIRAGLDDVGITLRIEYIDKRLERLAAAELVRKDGLRYELAECGLEYLIGNYAVKTIA